MDLSPKYIVEDDCLILAKVTYHKNLVTDKDKVKGGGWFRFLQHTDTFVFHGDSHEFGKASLEDVRKCVASGNVFTNTMKTHSIADKHHFAYDTGTEIVNL